MLLAVQKNCSVSDEKCIRECLICLYAYDSDCAPDCKDLLSLRVNRHPAAWENEVGDAALLSLAMCHKLKHLELANCSGCTDAGIRALITGCTRLELLDATGCDEITDACLVEIAKHTTLELVLTDCGQVLLRSANCGL